MKEVNIAFLPYESQVRRSCLANLLAVISALMLQCYNCALLKKISKRLVLCLWRQTTGFRLMSGNFAELKVYLENGLMLFLFGTPLSKAVPKVFNLSN